MFGNIFFFFCNLTPTIFHDQCYPSWWITLDSKGHWQITPTSPLPVLTITYMLEFPFELLSVRWITLNSKGHWKITPASPLPVSYVSDILEFPFVFTICLHFKWLNWSINCIDDSVSIQDSRIEKLIGMKLNS